MSYQLVVAGDGWIGGLHTGTATDPVSLVLRFNLHAARKPFNVEMQDPVGNERIVNRTARLR